MKYLAPVICMLVALCPAGAQEQTLLIQRNWSDMLTVLRDCVQVKNDGSYRFEHGSVSMQDPERHQIHVGKLNDAEMKQLTDMLAQPALASLTTPERGNGAMTVGTDVDEFWVAINRTNRPQMLFFDSTTSAGKKFSAGNRLPPIYKMDAMKPLLNWYKQMSKRKDDLDKTATPTCSFKVQYTTRFNTP